MKNGQRRTEGEMPNREVIACSFLRGVSIIYPLPDVVDKRFIAGSLHEYKTMIILSYDIMPSRYIVGIIVGLV